MDWKNAVAAAAKKPDMGQGQPLTTRWGEALQPDEVLQEYPRPQLRRTSYINLNGIWDCRIVKQDSEETLYEGEILVPFSPEAPLSGVNQTLQPGEVMSYHRTFSLEDVPEGKRLLLHFGAVDQCCSLTVNAVPMGEHIGGYVPFDVDITSAVRPGENALNLWVWDDTETRPLSRGKQRRTPGGMFYSAQSGIWQTVWMEWVPETYVKLLRITPEYDNAALRVEWLTSSGEDCPAVIYAVEGTRPVARWRGIASQTRLKIPNFHPWSPDDPHLYKLYLKIGEDVMESYFAMRTVTAEADGMGVMRLCLNHKPFFQNGVLDQGYWPDGLYTPPSDQAMAADITIMKALGFNLLRKHAKVEPLRWYYHCDRLGMLVWQDMVSGGGDINAMAMTNLPTAFPFLQRHVSDQRHRRMFGRKDEPLRKFWLWECQETVKLLYNSPCIVMWVLFNEGWGQFDSNKLVEQFRKWDPSRLIDAASGWFDQGGGDVRDMHNYFRKLTVPRDRRPVVLGEYGGYACRIADHSSRNRDYGYRKFQTPEELTDALKGLFAQLERLEEQGLSAAVYTQLSDIEEEVNGLLTYDRKVLKYQVERPDHEKHP